MIRKVKTLGLAVVAVLAMSAFVASAAQAVNITTESGSYPATVTAGQLTTHEFTVNGRTITCTNVSFSGTLSASSTAMKVKPSYSTCHTIVFGETWPVTVTVPTNCEYELTPDVNQIHVLSSCTPITIHVYSSASAHASNSITCQYTISAQTIGSTGVAFTNTKATKGSVDVELTAASVAVKRTVGSALLCGAENQTASYSGKSEAKATIAGVDQGLHVK